LHDGLALPGLTLPLAVAAMLGEGEGGGVGNADAVVF
jgi:hypothetical protein